MPLLDGEAAVAGQSAEHGNARIPLDGLPDFALLPRRADLVQDDARDLYLRVEDLIAQHQRSHPARHAERVDDEDDGRRGELRQRGARVLALKVDAIVQALVALDQREIRAGRARCDAFRRFRHASAC